MVGYIQPPLRGSHKLTYRSIIDLPSEEAAPASHVAFLWIALCRGQTRGLSTPLRCARDDVLSGGFR
jgi:hypothetical protein